MYQITGRYECIGRHDGELATPALRKLYKRRAGRKQRRRVKRQITLAIKWANAS